MAKTTSDLKSLCEIKRFHVTSFDLWKVRICYILFPKEFDKFWKVRSQPIWQTLLGLTWILWILFFVPLRHLRMESWEKGNRYPILSYPAAEAVSKNSKFYCGLSKCPHPRLWEAMILSHHWSMYLVIYEQNYGWFINLVHFMSGCIHANNEIG